MVVYFVTIMASVNKMDSIRSVHVLKITLVTNVSTIHLATRVANQLLKTSPSSQSVSIFFQLFFIFISFIFDAVKRCKIEGCEQLAGNGRCDVSGFVCHLYNRFLFLFIFPYLMFEEELRVIFYCVKSLSKLCHKIFSFFLLKKTVVN